MYNKCMRLLSVGILFPDLTCMSCQDTYSVMAYMGHHDFQVDELFNHTSGRASLKEVAVAVAVSVCSSKMTKML